jgi:hypothetical protein
VNPDGRDLPVARPRLDLLRRVLLRREPVHHLDRFHRGARNLHRDRIPLRDHPSSAPLRLRTGDPTPRDLLPRLVDRTLLGPHQFPNPDRAHRADRLVLDHSVSPGQLLLRRDDPDWDDGRVLAALAPNRG